MSTVISELQASLAFSTDLIIDIYSFIFISSLFVCYPSFDQSYYFFYLYVYCTFTIIIHLCYRRKYDSRRPEAMPKFSCLHLFFLLRSGDPCLFDECNKNDLSTGQSVIKIFFTIVSKIFRSKKLLLSAEKSSCGMAGGSGRFFPDRRLLVHFKAFKFCTSTQYFLKHFILYFHYCSRKIIQIFFLLIILF